MFIVKLKQTGFDGEFIAKNPVSSFLIININTLFSPLESWPRLEAIMVEN